MPGLLVEMFAYRSGNAANWSLASASAHDVAKADEARHCVLAPKCRAGQGNRVGESRTTQGSAESSALLLGKRTRNMPCAGQPGIH